LAAGRKGGAFMRFSKDAEVALKVGEIAFGTAAHPPP
jgi:hypothetical protein